jgi:anti-sigma-K factor RskA
VSSQDTTRDPFLALIEAYALGALDADERASVEAHLAAGCAECAQSLEEARLLVSQLAYLAPEAQPSEMLRGRLLKTVRDDSATGRALAGTRKAIPFWMWAGVAAALLLALYNLYDYQSTREAIRQAQAALDEQIQLQKQAAQALAAARREALILTDPGSLRILMPAGKTGLPELHATWHATLGIVISGEKLPVPGGQRTLQLWLIPKTAGAKPIPSLNVRPESDGRFHLLVPQPPDQPGDTKLLAITEEPEGGSDQPTTPPMWVGAVEGK